MQVSTEENKTKDPAITWDYSSPCAMAIFNKNKKKGSYGFKSCMDMATAIVDSVPKDDETIEKVEMKKMGNAPDEKANWFINITIKNQFIHSRINALNNVVGPIKIADQEE